MRQPTRRTAPYTGAEYLDRLRDGREVWIDGERVADVTTRTSRARRSPTTASRSWSESGAGRAGDRGDAARAGPTHRHGPRARGGPGGRGHRARHRRLSGPKEASGVALERREQPPRAAPGRPPQAAQRGRVGAERDERRTPIRDELEQPRGRPRAEQPHPLDPSAERMGERGG